MNQKNPRIVYTTIVSESYLPKAMVLIDSIKKVEPTREVVVMLCDLKDAGSVEPIDGVEIRGWDCLGLPSHDYLQMGTYYEAYELATAIKPLLFRRLLEEFDGVVFLDPDMKLYTPLSEVPALLEQHACVLIPHIVRQDVMHDVVGEIVLRYGMWQMGFGAFARGAEDLLDWWWARNQLHCVAVPSKGYWCDQRWMDIASVLFDPIVHCLDHPGYDVGYWNVHERPMSLTADGEVIVGPRSEPLRFYHFSGFWPTDADQWAVSFAERSGQPVDEDTRRVLRLLYADYEEHLNAASARRNGPKGYRFSVRADGGRISAAERRAYRAAMLRHPDPATLPTALTHEESERYKAWRRSTLPRRVVDIALTPVSYDLKLLITDHKVPALLKPARQFKRALQARKKTLTGAG